MCKLGLHFFFLIHFVCLVFFFQKKKKTFCPCHSTTVNLFSLLYWLYSNPWQWWSKSRLIPTLMCERRCSEPGIKLWVRVSPASEPDSPQSVPHQQRPSSSWVHFLSPYMKRILYQVARYLCFFPSELSSKKKEHYIPT